MSDVINFAHPAVLRIEKLGPVYVSDSCTALNSVKECGELSRMNNKCDIKDRKSVV